MDHSNGIAPGRASPSVNTGFFSFRACEIRYATRSASATSISTVPAPAIAAPTAPAVPALATPLLASLNTPAAAALAAGALAAAAAAATPAAAEGRALPLALAAGAAVAPGDDAAAVDAGCTVLALDCTALALDVGVPALGKLALLVLGAGVGVVLVLVGWEAAPFVALAAGVALALEVGAGEAGSADATSRIASSVASE